MAAGDRSSADVLLLAALVGGATHAEAATAAKLGERTVRRRLDDHDFRVQLDAARADLLARTLDRLAAGAETAARRLVELLDADDTPPAVRVSAARALLGEQRAYRDAEEMGARLDALEAALVSPLRAAG